MPAIRNALGTFVTSATATGLTGLNNASPLFSWGAWLRMDPAKMGSGQASIWCHADNASSPRNGVGVFVINTGELRLRPWTASQQLVQSPHGVVDGRWAHYGIRKDANAVTFFKNGRAIFRVANTITMTVSGTRLTQVGLTIGGIQSLAGAYVWDIRVFPVLALTDAEMAALADPRSHITGCKQRLFWQRNWRAIGSGAITLPDESGTGNNLTTSATSLAADAIAEPDWYGILRGRRTFGRVASGGAAALAGDILAALTTTGALTVDKPLAGSISAVVTSTGTLTVPKPLAAALDIAVTLTGGLAGSAAALAGAISAVVTATGALTVPKPLAGALGAAVTAAGSLTVPKPLAGAISAAVTLTGSIGAGVSGLITATLTWIARYSASLTATARHSADLTAQPRHEADLTAVPRIDADLTYRTED